MEDLKKITNAIITALDSWLIDFDGRKLDALDKFLFLLLRYKEILALKGKKKEAMRYGVLIDRWSDYRNILMKKSLHLGISNKMIKEKLFQSPSRLILLITHNCQLRCSYCRVGKYPAVMNEQIMKKGINLALSFNRTKVQIQFFGGEPLLCFDIIKKAVYYANALNKKKKKDLSFIVTTNGIALTPEKIKFFKKHRFIVECSFDGEASTQLKNRKAKNGSDYYNIVEKNFRNLTRSGAIYYSISVVTPKDVSKMYDNFIYLVRIGFRKIQINYNLGVMWRLKNRQEFFRQNKKIIAYAKKNKIEFINLTKHRKEPVVLNAEHTVDCDGEIYLESGICLEEDFENMKKKFRTASLKGVNMPHLTEKSQFKNFYKLEKAYCASKPVFRDIILNNVEFGLAYKKYLET